MTLIACLRTLKEQSNGSDYLLEDGTGTICGHVWANDKNGNAEWMRCIREGEWVRVYGQLKMMTQTRYLAISQIHKLASSDDLTHHFLATIALHLGNTGRTQVSSKSGPSALSLAGFAPNDNVKAFSPIQQAVQQLYSQCKTDQGVHINSTIQALRGKYAEPDVRSTVAWLTNEGYLYHTIDNDHARSTD